MGKRKTVGDKKDWWTQEVELKKTTLHELSPV